MKTINTFFAEELSLISLEVRLDDGKTVQVWFNPITGYISVGRDLITGRFVSVKNYVFELTDLGYKAMKDEGIVLEESVVIECPLLAPKKPLQLILMVEDTNVPEEVKMSPKASNAALELLNKVRSKQTHVQPIVEKVSIPQDTEGYKRVNVEFNDTIDIVKSKPLMNLHRFQVTHWGNFSNWTTQFVSVDLWKAENRRFFNQMLPFISPESLEEVKIFCREVYVFVEKFISLRGDNAKIPHKMLVNLIRWYAKGDLEEFPGQIFEGSGNNIKQYPCFLATNLPLEQKVAVGDRRIANNPNSYICGDNFKTIWDSFKQNGGHMYYRHAGGYLRLA